MYIPVVSYILLRVLGKYTISSILYPYQNSITRESLDRGNSAKYGDDLSHLLESMSFTIRLNAGMDAYNPTKEGG
jgi:ABC-type phosphate transport system auxiliary subunit